MNKLEDAKGILEALQVPERQQSELCCCYTLLALAGIKKRSAWSSATNDWIRIHDVLVFLKEHYAKVYAENSRETFRKQAMHHFRTAAFIEDNGKATNSPDYRYRLTPEMLELLRSYKRPEWDAKRTHFLTVHESLKRIYASRREMKKVSVDVNGISLLFSFGKHNQLQKAILEEFAPRFAPNSKCLYVGDTAEKDLLKDTAMLQKIGLELSLHDKMPDIVLYSSEKDWLYFIEAVTSVGPMNPKRLEELGIICEKVCAGIIYVTAFPDFATYKRFAADLAWETEVWIAENPDHMIHLNGDKFIGPRK